MKFRKISFMLMAIFAVVFAASCGGGGGGSTPSEPTAVYAGAATVGDIFIIKMDYPATGKVTITRSATDGTLIGSKEMTYTSSGNKYTFTDSDDNSFTALMVPDTMLVTFLPATDEKDLIIAAIVDPTLISPTELDFVKNHDYILTQFRHDEKGVKWVRSHVDADGVITGHHAVIGAPGTWDLDDITENNDFAAGMDVDDVIYNEDTNGFTLTLEDEGETQTWTYYFTESGIGIIDKGANKGIRFNDLRPDTAGVPAGIAAGDVYDTLFYGRHSETEEGTTEGTITVTEVGADYMIINVDNGRDAPETGIRVVVDPSDLWRGLFRIEARVNAVLQLIGSDAFVFAGRFGPWQYEYGVGVKR